MRGEIGLVGQPTVDALVGGSADHRFDPAAALVAWRHDF
jgi:hypothetical protein